MADCHRRVFHRQLAKAASGPTTRDDAAIQPPHLSEEKREVHGGLSCEIVSDLCPNPLSHDWHVQPSCQRPNRLPPERRAFRSRRTHFLWANPSRVNPAVLETFQPYRPRKTLSMRTSHSISTCFPHAESVRDGAARGAERLKSAQRYGLPLWNL